MLVASGIAALLLCVAGQAQAQDRGTWALRLGIADARTVAPDESDLGLRLTVAASVHPWKLVEIEGDLGMDERGGTGGLRAGLSHPFRDPAAGFQVHGVLLVGYRAMLGWDLDSSPGAPSHPPGLPVDTLLHVGEVQVAIDATTWELLGGGLTARVFVGALVAPWAEYVGFAPEIGAAAGLAF